MQGSKMWKDQRWEKRCEKNRATGGTKTTKNLKQERIRDEIIRYARRSELQDYQRWMTISRAATGVGKPKIVGNTNFF